MGNRETPGHRGYVPGLSAAARAVPLATTGRRQIWALDETVTITAVVCISLGNSQHYA